MHQDPNVGTLGQQLPWWVTHNGCKKRFPSHPLPSLQLVNVVVTVRSEPGDPPRSSGSKSGGGAWSRLKPVELRRSTALLGCIRAKAPLLAGTPQPRRLHKAGGRRWGRSTASSLCHPRVLVPKGKAGDERGQHSTSTSLPRFECSTGTSFPHS